jgi:L-ascorbate metabolism protein UlaG (beta-lactamase superfamily)
MQITWKGQACFSIGIQPSKQEQVRLVVDPFDSSIGLKPLSGEADIVLVTHEHEDHNNIEGVGGEPFVISNPGEYEIKDIYIKGIASFHDDAGGKERGMNTIYVIEAEGMRLCHLGDIGQKELTANQVSEIGNIDILFVPVGGVYTVGAKGAAKIVNQIEPRSVVPMHYLIPKLKIKLESADAFLKEVGVKDVESQGKLNLKSKDFSAEEMKIMLLTPS